MEFRYAHRINAMQRRRCKHMFDECLRDRDSFILINILQTRPLRMNRIKRTKLNTSFNNFY